MKDTPQCLTRAIVSSSIIWDDYFWPFRNSPSLSNRLLATGSYTLGYHLTVFVAHIDLVYVTTIIPVVQYTSCRRANFIPPLEHAGDFLGYFVTRKKSHCC